MKQFYVISLLLLFSISLSAQCGGGKWIVGENLIGFGTPAKNAVSADVYVVDGHPAIVFNRKVVINSVEFISKNVSTNTYATTSNKETIPIEQKGDQLLITDSILYEQIHEGWFIKLVVYITVDGEASSIKICKCFE